MAAAHIDRATDAHRSVVVGEILKVCYGVEGH
eukprot:COSAG02_NODE_34369_length_485_cov_0.797927_2_plen_31_part_01